MKGILELIARHRFSEANTKISAFGSAAKTYQNSVLASPPNDSAISGGGWTWQRHFLLRHQQFNQQRKTRASGTSPNRLFAKVYPEIVKRSAGQRAFRATILWASGRSTISHDSPIRLLAGKFLAQTTRQGYDHPKSFLENSVRTRPVNRSPPSCPPSNIKRQTSTVFN